MLGEIGTADVWLAAGMFLAATLYSSVGHAGASAYLALMALFGVPQTVMRPTALVLNIVVASLVSTRFIRAGLFRWRTLWPFLIGAVPFAFLGGTVQLPGHFYKPLVGIVLLVAAIRFLWKSQPRTPSDIRDVPVPLGAVCGAGIGLLSGLTGTGGGIFLSPILLFAAWSETRMASGIAATFILCNSVAGFLGNFAAVKALPAALPLFLVAVLLGGLTGSALGIQRLPTEFVIKALGAVLTIAGIKLIAFS